MLLASRKAAQYTLTFADPLLVHGHASLRIIADDGSAGTPREVIAEWPTDGGHLAMKRAIVDSLARLVWPDE